MPASPAQTASANFDRLLKQAFSLHRQGQYHEALPVLRQALKLQPGDYFVNLLLGIDLLRTGRREEAIAFLRQASQLRPKEEFPYEYLGEAQAGLGRFAEAAESYAQAVKVAPGSQHATVTMVDFSLARFAEMAGRMRSSNPGLAAAYRLEAMAHPSTSGARYQLFQRAAALDENAPGIWSDLAWSALLSGAADAGDILQQATIKEPENLRLWTTEALLAAKHSDWQAAAAKLNAVAQRSPAMLVEAAEDWPSGLAPAQEAGGPAHLFFRCVKSAACSTDNLRRQMPAPARPARSSPGELFAEQRWELLSTLPAPALHQPVAWFQRGVAFAQLGNCGRAIPALERGLGDPPAAENMFWLSYCYARQAGAVADGMQQSGDDEAAAHMVRGDVLLRLRSDQEGAVKEYQAALAAHPGDPAILERLAEAQFGAGQSDAARQNAQAALRLDPLRPSAMRTLANIALQDRDYAAALPYLQKLAERTPQDLSVRVDLGRAYAQTNSLEAAWQNLGPVLQQGYPDEKGALHYLLGTVLRRLGKTSEAEQAFATSRELAAAFQRRSHQNSQDPPPPHENENR
ncbi:MAG: tetratricopeptide repeat protein [Acidobacteria bacterium]|nr:tetratricopeptide repeat protein [Acidobacteriota bacterium]